MHHPSSTRSSEKVYYMDRSKNIIITDHRLVIGNRHLAPAEVRRARVEGKHTGDELHMEIALKAIAPVAMAACLAGRFLFTGTPQGDTLFGLSAAVLAVCALMLLLLTLSSKNGHTLVLHRRDGKSEELLWDATRQESQDVAHAVMAAIGKDHRLNWR